MTPRTFYRLIVWLPLVVPGVVALVTHGAGIRPAGLARLPAQILLGSLLLGGIPYGALALWATFWMERRSEQQIRQVATIAPLLACVSRIVVWTLAFFGGGGSIASEDEATFFLATALLGIVMVMALGYMYVAIAFGLRRVAGNVGWLRENTKIRV